jgi:DNA-binding LytR/AlgR family response regulator
MDTLRIAICEDTQRDAERLRRILNESETSTVVHVYGSADAFLHAYTPDFFHLVFLDIYLKDAEIPTGVEIAKKIREVDERVRLVFTTTSEDHALEGFAVKASQYLIKPVQDEDVNSLLLSTIKFWDEYNDSITVKSDRHDLSIKTQEIIYIEVQGKQSVIHLQGGGRYYHIWHLMNWKRNSPHLRF